MKQSIWTSSQRTKVPEAFITVNKNRLKQVDGQVYLKNGDNFEIELFNPTQSHIMAKITIGSDNMGDIGLSIRPGERVFLERYLNTNNKFLFSTYKVDGGSQEVLDAIQNNGVVSISFHKEKVYQYIPSYVYGNSTITHGNSFGYVHTTTSDNIGAFFNQGAFSRNISSRLDDQALDFTSYSTTTEYAQSEPIETGVVDRGLASNQSLSTTSREFEPVSYYNIQWNILPESRKVIESSDIKLYCTECGVKIKSPKFKFCPNCGNKIN
jgi:hypothetical protein